MKVFLSLLKLQINSQFGFSLLRQNLRRDKKTVWKILGLALIILISVGQMGFFYTLLINSIYDAALILNTPGLILTIGAVIAGAVTLFLGVIYILSALFFARDTELLFTLPIPQSHVFMAKFILVLLSEYLFVLFVMLPPVFIYGIRQSAGVLYYLTAAVCILLLPALPLLAASLLSLVFMRFISRIRRRNFLLSALGILLMAGVVVGQNLLVSRMPQEGYEDFLLGVIAGSRSLIDVMGRAFFPSIFITKVLTSPFPYSFFNLSALVGITAAVLAPVWFFSSFIFQRGALAQLETAKSSRPAKMRYSGSTPVMTFFKLEWKNLLRTPVYAMNALLQMILFPLLIMLPMITGGNSADMGPAAVSVHDMISGIDSGILILIAAGVMAGCCFLNAAVSTSFSREGKQFWILKSVPVPASLQVAGKLISGYSISFLTILLCSAAMAIAFHLSLFILAAAALLAAAVSVAPAALSLLVDLMRPKLVWNNPQQAIKQNLNSVLSMLLSLFYLLLFAGFALVLLMFKTNASVVYAVLFLTALLVSALSVAVLMYAADPRYRRIEP